MPPAGVSTSVVDRPSAAVISSSIGECSRTLPLIITPLHRRSDALPSPNVGTMGTRSSDGVADGRRYGPDGRCSDFGDALNGSTGPGRPQYPRQTTAGGGHGHSRGGWHVSGDHAVLKMRHPGLTPSLPNACSSRTVMVPKWTCQNELSTRSGITAYSRRTWPEAAPRSEDRA